MRESRPLGRGQAGLRAALVARPTPQPGQTRRDGVAGGDLGSRQDGHTPPWFAAPSLRYTNFPDARAGESPELV